MLFPTSRIALAVWLGVLVAGLPSSTAVAQIDADGDTLVVTSADHLESVIGRFNPDLAASILSDRAQNYRAQSVQLLPDPSIMLTTLPLPVHTARGEQQLQLRAEQRVPWPGKTRLQRRIAELDAASSETVTGTIRLELRLAALERLLELDRVKRLQGVINEYSTRLADMSRIAGVRYEVGRGPQAAIVKSQVERSNLELRLARLNSAQQTAYEELQRIVGRPVLTGFSLSASIARDGTSLLEASPDSLLAVAIQKRPAFERYRIRQTQDQSEVQSAHLALKPDFGVSAAWFSIGASSIPPASDGRDALAVGVSVRIPLYRQNIRANIERAELNSLETEQEFRRLTDRTRADINTLLAEIRSARRQLNLYQSSLLPQAELAAETSLRAYESGISGYLDLLDAERTLFQLRISRIDTEINLLRHLVRLERIVGAPIWTTSTNHE